MHLSVITINYNNLSGLKKTMDSVLSQRFKDYEWIVIDGGSTDGSRELLEEYGDRLSFWVSEPDGGIYNAMNKGIRHASGEYLHFLNSGDYLASDDVYSCVFDYDRDADIIYGSRINVFENGSEVLDEGLAKSGLTFDDIFCGGINHTTAFIRRSLFDTYGLYDESYRIVADSAFFLKAVGLGRATTEYVNKAISYFDMTGISKRQDMREVREREFSSMFDRVLTPELNRAYRFYRKYGDADLDAALSFYGGYHNMLNRILGHKISVFFFRVSRFLSKI